MQVRRQTFITWCLAAAALHSAASQSPGRPPLAPPPGTRGPFSPQDTEGGRDLLSEGLSIPLLWGSPASIQIPALMLLTVVLLFFTAVARDSFLSLFEAPTVPSGLMGAGQRPMAGSMGAGRRPMAGRSLLREVPQYEAFASSVVDATEDLKFL
ncbi:uncharacterized protein LOC119573747 [Penaeus monodon]|uniref:uncharacterized protein LOC119573747 n=1 Tax=Penaeus monodon TaxID=6687 RepID=UPI0018A7C92E|nr:uncharacterized protein LOC119573747 [Penaeus monodon]